MNKLNLIVRGIAIVMIVFTVSCSPKRPALDLESIQCGNNMVAIGFALRMWADDHDGRWPSSWLVISNELGSPKLLICPGAHSLESPTNWASFDATKCSYVLTGAGSVDPARDSVIASCNIHGHLLYADDTVFDGKLRRRKIP